MRISDLSSDVCSSDLDQVNAFSAFQPIRTGRAIEPVVACTAVEVVAITTINRQRGVCGGLIGRCKAGVCRPTREQHIVAIATQQPVVELAADEQIGSASCRERGLQYE